MSCCTEVLITIVCWLQYPFYKLHFLASKIVAFCWIFCIIRMQYNLSQSVSLSWWYSWQQFLPFTWHKKILHFWQNNGVVFLQNSHLFLPFLVSAIKEKCVNKSYRLFNTTVSSMSVIASRFFYIKINLADLTVTWRPWSRKLDTIVCVFAPASRNNYCF